MTERLRILVVDDHPVFRMGLIALLSSIEGLEVVAEADSLATAVAAVETSRRRRRDDGSQPR